MKFSTFILATLMLALFVMPCSDGQNLEDQHSENISVEHNHQEDSDDTCPIACICNCCGISITCQPFTTFVLIDFHESPNKLIATYQSNYRFDFHSNIWQPPQV